MKTILKSVFYLLLLFHYNNFYAQDCPIEDPLMNFNYDEFTDPDNCCQQVIGTTTNLFYDIYVLNIPETCEECDAQTNPYTLFSFHYPGGVWIGSLDFCNYGELATHLNNIPGVNDTFLSTSGGVNAENPEPGYGALGICVGNSCTEEFNSNDPNNFIANSPPCQFYAEANYQVWDVTADCDPFTAPEINPYDIGSTAPVPNDDLILNIPGQNDDFTTNDLVSNWNFEPNDHYTGPSGNAIGNILNAINATGVIQNGAGCTNVNCYDLSGLAEQLNMGEMADNLNENIEGTPPTGNASTWSEYLSDEVAAELTNINLAELLNNNFGFNIPNLPCDELIPIPLNGEEQDNALRAGEPGQNGGSRSMMMDPVTQADNNFFNAAVPGMGAGNPGSSSPSPSALASIQDVKGGVSLYNGAQSTSIPLYNIQANDISLPISLRSSDNGLKVNDMGSIIGQHWNLNAGGMITREVKGLPDEYDGTYHGKGRGKVNKITPFIQFPSNVGLDVKIMGLENFGCFSNPVDSVIMQKLKLGFKENIYPQVCTEATSVKIYLSWTALRGNRISLNFKIRILNLTVPDVEVWLEFGLDFGVNVSQVLGEIEYEERGLGFSHLNDASKMDDFNLDPLTPATVSNLNTQEHKKLFNKIHASKWYDDLKFFGDQIAIWDAWIEAITGDNLIKSTKIDELPDVFHVDIPGFSGRFSFNLDGSVVIFPHQEGIHIEKHMTDSHISGFTIKTPDGMQYELGMETGAPNYYGVDFTENTNYYLPNFYTYPEIGTSRNRFDKAQVDVGQLTYFPFIGIRRIFTYGNTYDRNFKKMESPKFSSSWHLKRVKSRLSLEEVELKYTKRENLVYYADKSFKHVFPDFGLNGSGELTTTANEGLNYPHLFSSQFENGKAEFSLSATETKLTRWDLKEINTSRKEHAEFYYGTDRGEIYGDMLLDSILIKRGASTAQGSMRFKGWGFNYNIESTEGPGPIICEEVTEDTQGVQTIIPGDTKFALGQQYELPNHKYHNYFHINIKLGCFNVPFRLNFGFLVDKTDWGYTNELGMSGSIGDVNRRLNEFNIAQAEAINTAEHLRSFLVKITEIDKKGVSHDEFITNIHYNEGVLPKRFSIQQDLMGYFNSNSNGSPLPPVNYISISESLITSNSTGVNKHFSFFNKDFPGNMQYGQVIAGDEDKVKIGALKSLKYGSGGEIEYTYKLNLIPFNGSMIGGAGLVVESLKEDPYDMPSKTTYYRYSDARVIADPIRIDKNDKDIYYPSLEKRVVCSSVPMNPLFANRGNHVGFGIVEESWEDNGKVVHYLTTPNDFSNYIQGVGSNIITESGTLWHRAGMLSPFSGYDDLTGTIDLPPGFEFPTEMFQISEFFGQEYRTEVFNKAGFKMQNVNNVFEYYGTSCDCEIDNFNQPETSRNNSSNLTTCFPSLVYFSSQRYQYNHFGSFWANYTHRLIQNYQPFYSGDEPNIDGLLNHLVSLILEGALAFIHPYKYVDRTTYISERCVRSGNVRSITSSLTNYFENNTSNYTTTSYNYGGQGHLPNIPNIVNTSNIDGSVEVANSFLVDGGTFLNENFDPNAVSYLVNEVNYKLPVYSITRQNNKVIKSNITSLKLENQRVVPWRNFSARNGETVFSGIFDGYNVDGKPINYYMAKHGTQEDDPIGDETLFFAPIVFSWTPELQLDTRSYLSFTTDYDYDEYYVLEKITDPDQIISTFTYDDRWRLKESTGMNEKRKTKYIYNIGEGENYLNMTQSFTDNSFDAQQSTQHFDGFGRNTSTLRNNDGAILSTTSYDEMFRVDRTSTIGRGGVSFEYDAAPINRIQIATDTEDNVTTTVNTGDEVYFAKTEVTDPNGHIVKSYSDGLGRMVIRESGEGGTTEYSYDNLNRLLSILNPENETYTYSYATDPLADNFGQLYSKKVPGAGAQTIWWDKAFRPIATADGNGTVQLMKYDEYNRITHIYKAPDGTSLGDGALVYEEDAFDGYLDQLLLQNNYDATHTWMLSTVEAVMTDNGFNGIKTTNLFPDDLGRSEQIEVIYPTGNVTTTFPLPLSDANIISESTTVVAGPGANNHTYTMKYDFDEVLRPTTSVIDFNSEGFRYLNQLFYNDADQVIKKFVGGTATVPLQKVDYAYDGIGRLTHINSPAESDCYQDLELCDLEVTFEIDSQNPYACRELTNVQIDGTDYLINPPLDIYNDPNALLTALETALDILGFFGEVTIDVSWISETTISINVLITGTDAQQVSLYFDGCGVPVTLFSDNCCTNDPVTNNEAEGLPAEYVDLYYQENIFNGLNINRINMALSCEAGVMRNDYAYDADHRVVTVSNTFFSPEPIYDAYSTNYEYYPAGSIKSLNRRGLIDNGPGGPVFEAIDQLSYAYANERLKQVDDLTPNPLAQPNGFKPQISKYSYDGNGNVIKDTGKGLLIDYNLLNLPSKVSSTENSDLMTTEYTYGGEKIKKESITDGDTETREYMGGFEFVNGVPEFFSHTEGRIVLTPGKTAYQWKLSDHLGNTVVLFEDKDESGVISTDTPQDPSMKELLQQTYYYAFGLPMDGAWDIETSPRMDYLYNGKEMEEELDLNWYSYGFRMYDPAIGRFPSVDPIADQFAWASPFNYAENEPVGHIDLWGLQSFDLNKVKEFMNDVETNGWKEAINDLYDFKSLISGDGEQQIETISKMQETAEMSENFKKNGIVVLRTAGESTEEFGDKGMMIGIVITPFQPEIGIPVVRISKAVSNVGVIMQISADGMDGEWKDIGKKLIIELGPDVTGKQLTNIIDKMKDMSKVDKAVYNQQIDLMMYIFEKALEQKIKQPNNHQKNLYPLAPSPETIDNSNLEILTPVPIKQ